MANTATFLTKALYQYLLDVSVRNNEHIEIGNEITDKEVGIPMQSSLEQLNFYTWLVTTLKLHNILEIGTYTGLSALAMAKGLSEGHIVCLDHSKQFTSIAKELWKQAGVADNIELRVTEALDTCEVLLEEGYDNHFDLVFIDADKENVSSYFEYSLKLLKKGGIVMIDNVLMNGDIIDDGTAKTSVMAMQDFNKQLSHDKRVMITMLPIGDGLSLATKL